MFSTEVSLCVYLCGSMCELKKKKEREKTVRKESTMNRNVNIVLQFGHALHVVVVAR